MRRTSTWLGLLGLSLSLAAPLAACDGGGTTGGGGSGAGPTTGGGGESEGGGGGGLTGEPVKILNWNLHNFFDTQEDPSNESDDSVTQNEYDQKLDAIILILDELDPDIMVLQEVENEAILEDMNAALGNRYPNMHILQGNDPRGVDICALSKVPFDNVVSHLDELFVVEGTAGPEFRWTRDLLEYHVTIGDQKVALLGVHYKAKENDNPDKRLAEGQRTRAIADELSAADPSLAISVLGDYNDLPGSPPLDAVTGSDPTYVDAADSVPSEDRWSFNFQGNLELIDHQIGNPNMMDRLDPASVTIRHGGDVDIASDHHPIMATYYFE
jgi:endonuclease/exonuclease/phosphatase family metal-dependent hydrolase